MHHLDPQILFNLPSYLSSMAILEILLIITFFLFLNDPGNFLLLGCEHRQIIPTPLLVHLPVQRLPRPRPKLTQEQRDYHQWLHCAMSTQKNHPTYSSPVKPVEISKQKPVEGKLSRLAALMMRRPKDPFADLPADMRARKQSLEQEKNIEYEKGIAKLQKNIGNVKNKRREMKMKVEELKRRAEKAKERKGSMEKRTVKGTETKTAAGTKKIPIVVKNSNEQSKKPEDKTKAAETVKNGNEAKTEGGGDAEVVGRLQWMKKQKQAEEGPPLEEALRWLKHVRSRPRRISVDAISGQRRETVKGDAAMLDKEMYGDVFRNIPLVQLPNGQISSVIMHGGLVPTTARHR